MEKIDADINYVGVDDTKIDLFEGLYAVPNGMKYNSYVIQDEKTAVLDTVDKAFGEQWLNNVEKALKGKDADYLIVQHMEPDHSANIVAFAKRYKRAKIVATAKAFAMMKNYFNTDFLERRIVVEDGDRLCLGKRELLFLTAPMVHWPEVMLTYEKTGKILFSADAFGRFGTDNDGKDWACEARRYYFGIVGKYGVQVQNFFKKLEGYEVKKICPLHGPILQENISYYLDLYRTWASYQTETDGVFIAYTSVYGNTKEAVEFLAERLKEKGCERVVVSDLARTDVSEAVENAFRYGKIVFATTTYNGGIFPHMRNFILDLVERNFQNKKVAFIENGSWAPMATRMMKDMLEKSKNLDYTDKDIKILSSVSEENKKELCSLAEALCKK